MKILVIGGTGTVGSQVVRSLLARNVDVRVLTRRPEKAVLPPGAAAVGGDLLDPATVRSVFRGMDGVFMLNALGPTETHEALMGVLGAQEAGVDRFVYLTIHRLDQAPYFPHFASKRPVESALRASGMRWTLVRPNNFFQNDLWYKEALLGHGVYPQPIGAKGLSRIDARDIADAAAIALTEPGHDGQIYELAGPQVLTGEEVAAIWSRALNKTIVYGGDDLESWERQSSAYLPPWLVYDLRLMYAWFQAQGFKATEQELARLTDLLGRPPRSFEPYAREVAVQWLA